MANVFTAFPGLLARLGVTPDGLIHVGAHEGQEVPYYRQAGIRHLTLVEPIPELARRLRRDHPDATVVEAACGSTTGRATLHIPTRSNMATLAPPTRRDTIVRRLPVKVVPLAEIQTRQPRANIAVIDAQGRELDVLASADLSALDLVIVETCTVADPTMASLYEEVSVRMRAAGFSEADRWVRDYDWVARWARGHSHPERRGEEVRDVVFIKKES